MSFATCHPDRPVFARGLCRACYRDSRPPSKCHPDHAEYVKGSGKCRACYIAEFRAKQAPSKCHPGRPEHVKGSGVCQVCYNRERMKNLPGSSCHPDRPAVTSDGLCQRCYDQNRRAAAPRATCHPERPEHVRGSGLCPHCAKKRNLYGVTIDIRDKACEICGTQLVEGIGKSAVDHDHKTGALRGLLCGSCNKMLGFARDDIGILGSAIKYLSKHHRKAG